MTFSISWVILIIAVFISLTSCRLNCADEDNADGKITLLKITCIMLLKNKSVLTHVHFFIHRSQGINTY